MKNINRNNYEAYFLDYLEGNLKGLELKEMELFLRNNPDLKSELLNVENLVLQVPGNKFSRKSLIKDPDIELKNEITKNNVLSYIIAHHEGDLNEDQEAALKLFTQIENLYAKEIQYFKNTYLKRPQKTQFFNKEKLYKTIVKPLNYKHIVYIISSAAAVIAGIMFLSGILKPAIIQDQTLSMVENNSGKTGKMVTREVFVKSKNHPPKKQVEVEHGIFIENTANISVAANPGKMNQVELSRENVSLEKIDQIQPVLKINSKRDMDIINPGSIARNNIRTGILPEKVIRDVEINRNGKNIGRFYDLNHDSRLNHWDIVALASQAINKISGEPLLQFQFTNDGKFSEFALSNDFVKISKTSKN